MKKFKSIFSVLSLALLFSINAHATTLTPNSGEPSSISKQVKSYLTGINLDKIDGETVVLVDFMLNSRGEIMILSTNNTDLDKAIKTRLNYKMVKEHKLDLETTYTLSLKFNT